jgi:hypothetical protein
VKVGEPAEHLGVAPGLHYDLVFEGLKFHGTIVGRRRDPPTLAHWPQINETEQAWASWRFCRAAARVGCQCLIVIGDGAGAIATAGVGVSASGAGLGKFWIVVSNSVSLLSGRR